MSIMIHQKKTGDKPIVENKAPRRRIAELEKELKDHKAFLRMIADNIGDTIRVIDLKTLSYTYANRSVSQLYGIPEGDYIGSPVGFNLEDDQRQWLFELIKDELEHDSERDPKRSRLIELREISQKHGGVVWTENHASFVRDANGKPTAILTITRDITDRKLAEQTLKSVKELYQTLAEKSFAGVYVVRNGKFRFINFTAASYADYKREELIDQEAGQLVHPEDREKVRKNVRAMLNGKLMVPYEFRIMTKQGETRWIMETVTSISYEGTRAILGNSMDITDRKKAEESLRESELRYRTLFNNANDAVFIMRDFKFIDCNIITLKIFGCSREQIIGSYPYIFSPPTQPDGVDSKEKALEKMNLAIAGEPQFFEWRHCQYDGNPFDAEVSLKRVQVGDEILIQAFVRDITDRKRMEESIRALIITDSLTGLYNRRGFLTLAEQQLRIAERTGSRVLLLFADLDGMKQINDHLGHAKGDEALIEGADVLKAVFRESDILARVGGDEFAVLALGSSREDSDILKDRLQQQMDLHNSRGGRDYHLSISIGIAYKESDSSVSIDELMSRADALMYEHKKSKHL